MMATGTTDPIRRATDKTWSNTLPLLTIEGSAGPDNAADAIYCQVYGGAEWNVCALPIGIELVVNGRAISDGDPREEM